MAAEAASPGRLPPPRLPWLWFLFAHLALATAFAAVAADPRAIAGFYYHPKMVAVVHLVTLGWISGSILGSLYILGPLALQAPLAPGKRDAWAFGLFALGVSGMASHFWLDEPSGMAWSALTVVFALLLAGATLLPALSGSRLPPELRLHFRLGFFNLGLAAALGLLMAIDKSLPFLPGRVLARVGAHAHLAILGWAAMVVVGTAYRLLPMLLPAAPPRGPLLRAGALLLEAGALGVAAALWLESRWLAIPALLAAAGLAVFVSRLLWMLRRPRPAPRHLVRPDPGPPQALLAIAYGVAAAALGLALALTPPGIWKMRGVMAYGTLILIGFLAQMVVGVSARLLPLFAITAARARRPFGDPSTSLFALPARPLQFAVFALWMAGVPALTVGLTLDSISSLRAGAALLLLATLLGAANLVVILRRSRA